MRNYFQCRIDIIAVGREVMMRVSAEEYSTLVSELSTFRLYMQSTVEETDQLTSSFADMMLLPPIMEISVSFSY